MSGAFLSARSNVNIVCYHIQIFDKGLASINPLSKFNVFIMVAILLLFQFNDLFTL